jgi:hypothetical protein
MLLASLAAGVFSFLLGWVLWGMMGLMDYFQQNMTDGYNALWKMEENMNMLGMIISNLAFGLLVGWVVWKTGGTTFMAGLMTGAIIGGLVTTSMDMFFYSMMNMYLNKMIVIIDILVSAVTTALAGGLAGVVLGMGGRKPA